MPIKNKPFFVPKSFSYQPDFYTEFDGRVNAVFTHPVKGCTLFLEIAADTYNYDYTINGHGNLVIECETEDGSYRLTQHEIQTLNEALNRLKQYLDDVNFGENLPERPIKINISPSKILLKPKKNYSLRKKKNGKPYRLTDDDKLTLLSWGHPESDFAQIEEAANRSTYILDGEKAINVWEAIEILGKETFLSGISRSAFHYNCGRYDKDEKHKVSFDSSVLFRQH